MNRRMSIYVRRRETLRGLRRWSSGYRGSGLFSSSGPTRHGLAQSYLFDRKPPRPDQLPIIGNDSHPPASGRVVTEGELVAPGAIAVFRAAAGDFQRNAIDDLAIVRPDVQHLLFKFLMIVEYILAHLALKEKEHRQ